MAISQEIKDATKGTNKTFNTVLKNVEKQTTGMSVSAAQVIDLAYSISTAAAGFSRSNEQADIDDAVKDINYVFNQTLKNVVNKAPDDMEDSQIVDLAYGLSMTTLGRL
jgi:enolase